MHSSPPETPWIEVRNSDSELVKLIRDIKKNAPDTDNILRRLSFNGIKKKAPYTNEILQRLSQVPIDIVETIEAERKSIVILN